MQLNHQFNIVKANNGYVVNVRDQDSYNQDTFVFTEWGSVTDWLKANEEYHVTPTEDTE